MEITLTKQGYDSLTETDPRNMIFSSRYAPIKILGVVTHSEVVAGDTVKYTLLSHSVGYTPSAFLFFQWGNSGKWYFNHESASVDGIPDSDKRGVQLATIDHDSIGVYLENAHNLQETVDVIIFLVYS